MTEPIEESSDDAPDLQSQEDSAPHAPAVLTNKSHSKRLKRLLLFLLSIYVGLCLMLMLIQRKLIYFPTREASLVPASLQLPVERFHQISLKSTDGLTLHGWHVLPPGRSALDEKERKWELELGRPVILFFPGNAGHRGYRSAELEQLSRLNADLFLIDYRGYGDNTGVPSEENFAKDARSVWNHLVESEGVSPDRILLLGESLGGGVAVTLANKLIQEGVEPGGLFLKTTFSSLVDVAYSHYPWVPCGLLMTERYPSADHIVQVTCPISILHGINDEIVPFELAQRLFEAAPQESSSDFPKTFIELPVATHNDVLQADGKAYLESVAAMLQLIRR